MKKPKINKPLEVIVKTTRRADCSERKLDLDYTIPYHPQIQKYYKKYGEGYKPQFVR